MRFSRLIALALPLLAFSALAETITLRHVTVIDMVTGSSRQNATVVIHGNRIVSVDRTGKQPAEGRTVEAHGQYLIPGLWDMHTQVYFDATRQAGTDLVLPLFLAFGVTGVRDMGSVLDDVLRARDGIAAHQIEGPRMVVSGPMLDGPASTYKAVIPIATPEDGRKAVDLLKQRGADFVKVQSGVPRDAYFAIAEEAKLEGIPFEGHVPDAVRAREAIAAGQKTFEHLIGIFEASSPDEDKYLTGSKTVGMFLATWDARREADMVALLAAHHEWQCPTLYWERGQWLVDAIDYRHEPYLAFAGHSWVTTLWPASRASILKTLDVDPLPVRQKFVDHELGIVRRLHAAQVPFLAGTDTPAGVDVIPGISLHRELERFVAAGFTPLEALQTATLNPALFFGKRADFGTVEPGKIADLVLLAKNPLVKISNTRTITGVIVDGRYYSKVDLERLRARLKQIAARE